MGEIVMLSPRILAALPSREFALLVVDGRGKYCNIAIWAATSLISGHCAPQMTLGLFTARAILPLFSSGDRWREAFCSRSAFLERWSEREGTVQGRQGELFTKADSAPFRAAA